MSDRFDPEAWPYPDDDEPANKASKQQQPDQDDYKSLDFDNPTGQPSTQGYGDPYSDAPYSDVGYDDYGYGPTGGAHGNGPAAAYDEPSQGFGGRVGADDDQDLVPAGRHSNVGDDDFGTAGSYANDRETYGTADDGYAFSDEQDQSSSTRSSGSFDEDDPYASDDNYDDDDYDDSYDDDDDYDDDREPKEKNGLARKLLGAGIIAVIALAAFFAFKQVTGNDDPSGVATTPPATEAPPAGETPPTEAPGGEAATATQAEAPAEVTDQLNAALAAWGRFAVSGNLDEVKPYFAPDGTQYESFESESTALKDSPPGGDPLSMTLSDPVTYEAEDGSWIVRGLVKVSRTGEQDQEYNWEFRMVNNDGDWQSRPSPSANNN